MLEVVAAMMRTDETMCKQACAAASDGFVDHKPVHVTDDMADAKPLIANSETIIDAGLVRLDDSCMKHIFNTNQ